MSITVLFDANVLYPASLRDLLLHLSFTNLFRAKWTNDIHDEWIRNVLKNRPDLRKEQLQRTRKLMDQAVEDCLVSGYDDIISSLVLPDNDDRHVLAAAIVAKAEIIVTYNLKDFPENILNVYGIIAQHPDDFINGILDLELELALRAIKTQRLNLKNPELDAEKLIAIFAELKLPKTVDKLKKYSYLI